VNRQNTSSSEDENVQRIREYLQQPEARERIQRYMRDVQSKATVTTSGAARIFGFGEQQLRDWEKKGLISTERTSQEGKETRGHRQFTFDELNKLAIIKELTKEGNFTPAEIPAMVDAIWREVMGSEEQQTQIEARDEQTALDPELPIIQHIHRARAQLFLRFYASHALRLALMLIAEDVPGNTVGLLLPMRPQAWQQQVTRSEDLYLLGETLLGWLTRSRSTHTLFTRNPSFEYSTDYRIHSLCALANDKPTDETPVDRTYIIVRRDASPLTLSAEVVETISALLAPLYEDADKVIEYFGPNMNDALESSPDLNNTHMYPDLLLDNLANMIVRHGGYVDRKQRWRFCCILLPKESDRPLQQRTLVVRAQSANSPHKVGVASVSPGLDLNSLSLRAYQSGEVCYRDKIAPEDSVIAFQDVEHPVNAAIAIPIGAEDGEPEAVIYVTSEWEGAFSRVQDRCILRLLGRMVGEVIRTYRVRLQTVEKLGNILRHPDVVDDLIGEFFSENKFIHDMEEFLQNFKNQMKQSALASTSTNNESKPEHSEEYLISLMGVDVDHLSSYALKYGERAVRNLCHEIGLRIKGELASTFRMYPGCKFYHIYADRFFIVLRNVPFDQLIAKARLLKKSLDGPYKINLFSSLPPAPGSLEEIKITVRLSVSAYNETTLTRLFEQHPDESSVYREYEAIERALATELKKGMSDGGNQIRIWNPTTRSYERLEES